jgi:hypothetical protein
MMELLVSDSGVNGSAAEVLEFLAEPSSEPETPKGVPFNNFAKEFAAAVQGGRIYSMRDIGPMIDLPASGLLQPEHVLDIVDFNSAFRAFKAAMVDTLPTDATLRRRTALVLNDTGTLNSRRHDSKLSYCANGVFVGEGLIVGNMQRYNNYNNRLHGESLRNPEKFFKAMRAAMIDAAAHGDTPIIIPAHDPDRQEMVLRLQAHDYDIVYKNALPHPAANNP